MTEKKYQLIFTGQLVQGFDIKEVKKNIKIRFKISDNIIQLLFSGQPMTIQRDLKYQTALKYCATLKDMGLLCKIQESKIVKKVEPKITEYSRELPESKLNPKKLQMVCPKCRLQQEKGEVCIQCGVNIQEYQKLISGIIQNVKESESEPDFIKKEYFSAFIGPNADRYIENFQKFRTGTTESFELTWNWSAFLFGPAWLLYRKMNKWALLLYLLYTIPYLSLICAIVLGLSGYYLYYNHVKAKILKLIKKHPSSDITPILSGMSGVYKKPFIILVTLMITILLYLIVTLMKHFN